ncbi:aminotransferase class I/II-fold pyridoxal phosphate-dependent enzyme [Paenibacillus sp. SYP-B3998]|uniref:Aminotransferase class I/II-fold pyridoxal phosphate-dependent enzyme n=1 Tax=Paenibacillus sp. SYP-B3998 TaxID=2678564 RepID=A0A6G3ZT18_9BACL|nr:aminotransferase class I/II-fold pyridoxal phosphate-dependent enzyme [Paenibacillus sp. SYP-B3998]NEW04731.1 aminotransferase class I/II-fold pyridoxal phosphate-dependent enzyme [Paenibacillus sp. SYP-B3998]
MQVNQRIYLSPPHMGQEEQQWVHEAFATNWIAPLGPNVDTFEKDVAHYVGASGALSLSSGTAAIHLALRLLDVGPGDVVFCSTLTFVASVNPVLYQGAEPVFIDSEPETWNMSSRALVRALISAQRNGKLPKAVIVVNLYGQSADMDPIVNICEAYNIPIIEDAAESLGATYQGKGSGTIGKFGIYSFNGNKIITTSGGGMLVSDDLEALDKARFWATQARDQAPHYEHSEVGYNYRMSNVLAGIGIGQLRALPSRIQARRAIFANYVEALGPIKGFNFMPEATFGTSTRWLTALTINPQQAKTTAASIIQALSALNIESRPVWKPMHLQPLFKDCTYISHTEGNSVSDQLFEQGLCLPSGSSLTEYEQERVIEVIKSLVYGGMTHEIA